MGNHDEIVTPQWTNMDHTAACNVWVERREAWEDLAAVPTDPDAALRVRELDRGLDGEIDACTCAFFSSEPPAADYPNMALALEALALAQAVDGFVARVAADTGTHDGEPRGNQWSEGPKVGAEACRIFAQRLRDLADLWHNG